MKKLILIGLLLIPIAFAFELWVSQEYIDGLNTTTMTWQTLLCTSDGSIHIHQGNVYTPYNCTDIRVHGEGYMFFTRQDHTIVPLEPLLKIYNETGNITYTEQVYWAEVTRQALENVDWIIHKIKTYQSDYDPGWDWQGNPFD